MDEGVDRAATARTLNRETRLEAARLLGRLLARAHDMLASGAGVEPSVLGVAMRLYWKERNLAGVHVYQAPDGWHAEVAFKNVPDGLAPMVAAPLPHPCASEAEALDQARDWLAMVLAADAEDLRRGVPPEPSERVFHLDGLLVGLETRIISVATRAATIARVSPDCAEARLHLLLAIDFPAGVTEAGWGALHPSRRMLYMGWIGLLLAHGQTQLVRTAPSIEA